MAVEQGIEVLTDAEWIVLWPLIEECRPRGKTQPRHLRRRFRQRSGRVARDRVIRYRVAAPFRENPTHEVPALPVSVDHRTGGADRARLPAVPVPGLRTAVQRADRHGAEPGPGAERPCVP